MNEKVSAPVQIKMRPGYTVDQLIKKLHVLKSKMPEAGQMTVAVCLPDVPGMPQRLMLAGEGLIGKASDGRMMLVIYPITSEGTINPFKQKESNG